MTQALVLKTTAGPAKACADLLARLIRSGHVAAALGPFTMDGAPPAHLLVSSPDLVADLALFHPRFAGNIAQAASRLTRLGPLPGKVAIAVRPCEAAALVELAKIKQVDLGSFVVVGVDCAGCIPAREDVAADIENHLALGSMVEPIRPACRICVRMGQTEPCDILVGAWGLKDALLLIPRTDQGAKAVLAAWPDPGKAPNPAEADLISEREGVVAKLRGQRQEARSAETRAFVGQHGGFEGILKMLEKCIACRNCSEVCPICYCKECKFKLGPMETDGALALAAAVDLGSARFPQSPLQYHLGRMVHMAESCVGCGACSDACPHDVPVSELFAVAADVVQGLFGYGAGSDPASLRPLSSFAENEFEDLGR